MSNFEIDDNEIVGYVFNIKQHFVEELTKYLQYENEELEDYVDMINATSDILQALIDYKENDYVKLKYNPMGAWYVDNLL